MSIAGPGMKIESPQARGRWPLRRLEILGVSHRIFRERNRLEDLFEALARALTGDQPADDLWNALGQLSEELQMLVDLDHALGA